MSLRPKSRIALSAGALAGFLATMSGCAEEPFDEQSALLGLAPGARNLARDPGTVASAQSTYPGYAAGKAIDGNTSTLVGGNYSWANAHNSGPAGRLPQWFQVDLAGARQIEGINLYTSAGYALKNYDIEAWDGEAWRVLVQQRDNQQVLVSHAVQPFNASKVRVTCLAGPNNQAVYARINELEIIGRDGAQWSHAVLSEGEGWQLVHIDGTDENGVPAVQEDVAILQGGAGVAGSPLPQIIKDELADASPEDVLVISDWVAREMVTSEAQGQLTPRLAALAEDGAAGAGARGLRASCNDQLVTKSRSLAFNGPYSKSFNLATGLTGTVGVSGGVQASATAEVRFTKKRRKILGVCIAYGARFDGASVSGQGQVTQGATLQGNVSYARDWAWDVAKFNLGGILFFVGPVPVYLDFKLPIEAGLELEASAAGNVQYNGTQTGTGSFNLSCSPSGCSGSGGWSLTSPPGQPLLNADLSARVEATPWIDVGFRVSLYHEDFVFVQGGLRPKLKADLWGYHGTICGDADQDGANETVSALTVDLDGELHITAKAAFLKNVAAKSWDLWQWSKHILFANLLNDTSAFNPMIAGPAAPLMNVTQSYGLSMRPCWPYDDKVSYEVTAAGAVTPAQGAAHAATLLGLTWPNLGVATISARALQDAHGRILGATTDRTVNVVTGTWTPWLQRDNPGGNGDFETLADFVASGQACAQPLDVRCETLAGVDFSATGQVYTCSPTIGGVCVNSQQSNGQQCLNYRVRFLCP